MQIGGGVRVGDAFQAIVGSKLIAIWDGGFVSKFLRRGIRVSFVLNKRNTHPANHNRAEGEASERVGMTV